MKAKWKYEWNTSKSSENRHAADTLNEITFMMTKGCRTKMLKAKMRKLDSSNDAI
jgi:hypothetical protein